MSERRYEHITVVFTELLKKRYYSLSFSLTDVYDMQPSAVSLRRVILAALPVLESWDDDHFQLILNEVEEDERVEREDMGETGCCTDSRTIAVSRDELDRIRMQRDRLGGIKWNHMAHLVIHAIRHECNQGREEPILNRLIELNGRNHATESKEEEIATQGPQGQVHAQAAY